MSTSSELAEYLKSLGYNATLQSSGEIRVFHPSLPVYLQVEFKDNLVYMSIKHLEEFREVLEDLLDSGENIEDVVEEALSYLSIASLKARVWVEKRGYTTIFKLRDGSLEIYEILEELLEEERE